MTYCSSHEVWKNLGKDAYTKVRSEIVGTASSTSSTTYDLDHDNVISNSETIYIDGSSDTTATLNYDDGKVTIAASSGSVISADYDYSDVPDSIVNQMISSSDAMVENVTGRTFNSSSTTEYLTVEEDQKTFFLRYYPIISLDSVERNKSSLTTNPDWETLTPGIGNDYLTGSADNEIGRIRFIDSFPYIGEDRLKVTYSYGYSSTPPLVKELSILLTLRQLANSSVYKSMVKGYDAFTPVRTTEIEKRIEELKKILRKQNVSLI